MCYLSTTISAAITGTTGLIKNGNGTLTLSGSNTYTGATTISVGTLALGASNVIADTSNVSVASGSTFALGGFSDTIGKLSGAGLVALGSGALTTTYGSGSGTFSGVISGNGSFTLAGPADYNAYLTISGSNTYTGATTLTGATLILGANNVISSSSALVISGGRLSASAASQTFHSLTMNSGAILRDGGTLTFSNGAAFNGGSVTIRNDGGVISSTGTTTLGNVTFTYNASTSGFNALLLGGNVVVTSGASALFKMGPAGGQGYMKLGDTNRVFDVGENATATVNWVIHSTTNSLGALTKNGTGTLTLTGNNTYTGATSISSGSIIVPKTTGASTATATFSATLSVSFNVSPPSGTTTFRFFPGATTNSYASVTLVGVPVGTTATYTSATSTLSVTVP
jgi:autotransporter-associated beta strand protein